MSEGSKRIQPQSDEAKKIVKKFCDKVFYLRSIYYIQESLFESEFTHLLDLTTPSFFNKINSVLVDYILLELSKISDPSKYNSNQNLSVENIINTIDWPTSLSDEIIEMYKPIEKLRKYINPARNKIIAHNDRQVYIDEELLGEFPKKLGLAVFKNLEIICNIFHKETYGSIYGEMSFGHTGDVKDFLKTLAKAVAFDELLHSSSGDDLLKIDSLFHKAFNNELH